MFISQMFTFCRYIIFLNHGFANMIAVLCSSKEVNSPHQVVSWQLWQVLCLLMLLLLLIIGSLFVNMVLIQHME